MKRPLFLHRARGSSILTIPDICLISASTLPLYHPLLDPRFFWSHEAAYPLFRLASLHQNVLSGNPLCRWFPDFARGFGLPILEFFPVLPLYIAEGVRLMGFSTINSLKILIVLMTIFAAVGAWMLGNALWGKSGGYLSAVLFSYAPYKIVNLYVRGDLNEYMAMAVSPWILYLILSSARQKNPPYLSVGTLAAMCIPAISHYPSSVIHYPMYTLWILILAPAAKKPAGFLVRNFLSLALALLMTSTYWASAFFSRHLVQMEGMTRGFADYKQHFIGFKQWFSFYWNYGASVYGPGDAISFQIGNFALLFLLIGLIGSIKRKNETRLLYMSVFAALVLLTASTFLTHGFSNRIWSLLPVLPLIQFPYRILSVSSLMSALLAGSLGRVFDSSFYRYRKPLTAILSLLVIGSSIHMCRVAEYLNLDETGLTAKAIRHVAHTHSTGEYIPQAVGNRFPPPEPVNFTLEKIPETGFTRQQTESRLSRMLEKAGEIETWKGSVMPLGHALVIPGQYEIIRGDIFATMTRLSPCRHTYRLDAVSPGAIRINQFYFEGWTATLNALPIRMEADPDTGLIRIDIPAGNHTLCVAYRNLPLSRYLGTAGLCTIIAICLLLIIRKFRYDKKLSP